MSKKTKGGAAAPFAPPLDPRLYSIYGNAHKGYVLYMYGCVLHLEINNYYGYYIIITF